MQKLFKPGATFEARVKNIDFIIENLLNIEHKMILKKN